MITLTLLFLTSSLVGWLLFVRCRQRLARCRIVAASLSSQNRELIQINMEQCRICAGLRRELSALREAPLKRWEAATHFPDESETVRALESIANQPLRTFGGREPQED